MSHPPGSPTPTSADSPFNLGMFSNPYTAAFCDPSDALVELRTVARNVEDVVSGSSKVFPGRKRRSIKTLFTNSLRRRRKKVRTQSCSEHFASHPQSDEENLANLVRSVSLGNDATVEASNHSNSTSSSYYNAPFMLDRPPRPPIRTHYSSNPRPTTLNRNVSLQENLPPRSPSEMLLRKLSPSNMKSSNILHQRCQKLELNLKLPEDCPDIFIVNSDGCSNSAACTNFFSTKLATEDGNLRIEIESVQEISGSVVSFEKLFHSKAQILVLSSSLLRWIYNHPDFIFGNLLDPNKLLVLLVDISATDILHEHRSSFLHFQDWKLLKIVDENFPLLEQKVMEEIQLILGKTKLKQDSDLDKIQFFPESVSVSRRDVLAILPEGLLADDLDFINFVSNNKSKMRAKSSSDFWVENHGCLKIRIPSKIFAANLNNFTIEFGFKLNVLVAKKLQVQTWRADLISDIQSIANTDSSSALNLFSLGCADEKLSSICGQVLNGQENADLITKLEKAVKTSSEPLPRFQSTLKELSKAPNTISSLPPIPTKRQNCNSQHYDMPRSFHMYGNSQPNEATRGLYSNDTYDLYHKYYQGCEISAQALQSNDECYDKNGLDSPLQASCVKQDFVDDEGTTLKTPQNPVVAPYIPMKSSTLSKSRASIHKESFRRRSSSTSQVNLMKDFAATNSTTLKPESRQEIIEKHFNDSKNQDDNFEEKERQENEGKSFQGFPDLFAFTPPVSMEDGAIKQLDSIDYGSAKVDLFESCQADLIDLQEKYKNEILSLAEVEERFEQWKCRPELNVCKGQRMQEIEAMRDEWIRLQTLAEQKKRTESHFMSLMRGWMRSNKKSSNSYSSEASEAFDFSSPQKSEGYLLT